METTITSLEIRQVCWDGSAADAAIGVSSRAAMRVKRDFMCGFWGGMNAFVIRHVSAVNPRGVVPRTDAVVAAASGHREE
jgi:hypothetical protein